MISQARTLRISDIQIGVPSQELTKDKPRDIVTWALQAARCTVSTTTPATSSKKSNSPFS